MKQQEIRYINTDLDLFSPHDLNPLADALANRGLWVLHVLPYGDQGLWWAIFETDDWFPDPDQTIAAILTAIETLDEPSRSLWEACTIRQFDIGYDCGDRPYAFNQKLSAATVARIASVGAALVITLYPAVSPDPGLPVVDP